MQVCTINVLKPPMLLINIKVSWKGKGNARMCRCNNRRYQFKYFQNYVTGMMSVDVVISLIGIYNF